MKDGLLIRISLFCLFFALGQLSSAQTSASSPSASPSLEQRVADLEAYVNNSARGADAANGQAISNISGPGPAHNAWMMTCAALVLFMTLPGLALFYGGLVRAKNVLSILAQCLGIAGLVTILWWAVGYSLVFSHGSPFIGGLKFAFLDGVGVRPNNDDPAAGARDVPAHVCNHHARINHWRGCGADEIRGRARVCRSVDVRSLFPDRAHGLGNRWLDEWRLESQCKDYRHRLRRRHGRAHVVRLVGARAVHSFRASDWI